MWPEQIGITLAPVRRVLVSLWLAVLLAVPLACSKPTETSRPVAQVRPVENPVAAQFAGALREQVNAAAMMDHLTALDQIAQANGGNRAVGSTGYEAAVDYVVAVLRDNGYDVQTPEFEVGLFTAENPVLTVGGAPVESYALKYSLATPVQGVSGPLVAAPAEDDSGCVPADFAGLEVEGAVVLVDRGGCPFPEKQAIAAQLGAVALIVANNVDEGFLAGTLGEQTDVRLPVVSVTKDEGVRLRAAPGPTTLVLDARTERFTVRNVIAQTKTGSPQDVVMVGAHLDTVPEGPGMNDNGSGVVAVLETAVQLGNAPDINHAVRFGFWGAEEVGLIGSRKYLQSLDMEQLKDIALYLNFDMLASPNAGYFTYDGNQSTTLGRDDMVPRIPEGSAGIERTLVAYLQAEGKPAQDTFLDGRSDYEPFTRAGIPAGGLFAGADGIKTAEQAELWGGIADAPFDPEYHTGTDTVDQIDREALGIQGGGVAYSVGIYAQDLTGRNGVPAREDRTRHWLAEQ